MSGGAEDRIVGALLGFAIGDALGGPLEGMSRQQIAAAGDLLKYRSNDRPTRRGKAGPWPPGTWTDDTQQSLVVAESILACGGIMAPDIVERLYRLWKSGEAFLYGHVFDEAMRRYDQGVPWDAIANTESALNGAAMRVIPVALWNWRHLERLSEDAIRVSTTIHREPSAVAGATTLAHAYVYALHHADCESRAMLEALVAVAEPLHRDLARSLWVVAEAIALPPDEAFPVLVRVPGVATKAGDGISGITTASLVACLYAFLRGGRSYEVTLETALRLGGDVDCFGAMAGGLFGARFGREALPQNLIVALAEHERIEAVARQLYRAARDSS